MEEDTQPVTKVRQTPVPSTVRVASAVKTTSGLQVTSAAQVASAAKVTSAAKVASAAQVDAQQEAELAEAPASHRKRRKVKRKKKPDDLLPPSFDIPGVVKVVISPETQILLECTVGDDVTAEKPWKYVSKEVFEDNLELHQQSSEFLPVKDELLSYPRQELLVGYIPDETRDYDEFYVCLAETAEDTVAQIIGRMQQQQEERLNNSIVKTIRPWKSLGSEAEIEMLTEKGSRPLLEVEVETDYPVMTAKCQFRLRMVQNARDGYAELLAGRTTYVNLYRKHIDAAVQVTPPMRPDAAQTVCTYPRNAWTQYEYEYAAAAPSQEFQEQMRSFMVANAAHIDDKIYVNSHIDFYKNDYSCLVRDERFCRIPEVVYLKEYLTMIEAILCSGKRITSLSWHPMWTGTLAIAYSDKAHNAYRTCKPNEDEVTKAIYEVIPVLLWSFKDSLDPRLLLETPREVTALSFCPYDENIVVGGCINGQIIIWDIRDKLKTVEEEEILTPAQHRYRALMHSLMNWMKNTKDLKIVRTTVISELEYSHRSAVTSIAWISSHREVSRSGLIKDIPEEEERTSLQFITSSNDGTVVTWDLLAKPSGYTSSYRPQRKLRRLKKRPSALTLVSSPWRALNRVFRPIFKVNVLAPGTSRNLPVSCIDIRASPTLYEEKFPDPKRKFKISDRILYKPIFQRPTHPLVNQFAAGTTEGDFLIATWTGFEFNAGEVVNKETCKFKVFAKFHDGPVLSISRSDMFPRLLLTVGGKVFAIWMLDFLGKPIFWRRSKHKYTHGVWHTYRPSAFRLTRDDGYIELWQLKIRSDRYHSTKTISGGSLGGTFTQPFNLKQNVMAIADANGSLRLFLIAKNLSAMTEEDKLFLEKLCEREADRKLRFIKWQDKWRLQHAEWIKLKSEQDRMSQEKRETEEKSMMQELVYQKAQVEMDKKLKLEMLLRPEPGHYSEWAQQQWKLKEEKRMNRAFLNRKALNIDLLERQQLPLMKATAEEHKKKTKRDQRLGDSQKIFEDAVTALFPSVVEKKPPPPPDPYGGGDPMELKAALYDSYTRSMKQYEKSVQENTYTYRFNWLNVLEKGKERRKFLDGYHGRYNHTFRMAKERTHSKSGESLRYVHQEIQLPETGGGSVSHEISAEEATELQEDTEQDGEVLDPEN